MRAEELVGTWIMESFQMEDCATGRRTQPWGRGPSGTVVFVSEGRMFALITADGRPSPSNEADEAAAFRRMLAYSGQYRIEPPNRLVTAVDIAWFEPWVGSEQVRYCELSGDNLIMTSAPLNLPQQGSPAFAVVTWRRERQRRAPES
jgi:hypothetical protein